MALIVCQNCQSVISIGEDDTICPNCGELVFDPEDKNVAVKRKKIPRSYIYLPLFIVVFVGFAILLMLLLKDNYQYIEAKVIKLFFATTEDFFNLFFFAIIFGLFSWALILFRIQIRKTRKALKEGFKYVGPVNADNMSSNFLELDEKFRKNLFFELKWKEFDKTIKKIETDGKVKYCNTIDVSHFFNEDSLFFNRFLSSFIFSIPTMLTGIGIFGTFFGLVVGLQPFKYITDFSNSKEVSLLTSQLLSGISTAFLSSLWGILFSLLLNFFLSHGKSVICNEIVGFTEKLRSIFPRYIEPEKDDLTEIKKMIESHNRIIDKLAEGLEN